MTIGASKGSSPNVVYTFCMLSQFLEDNERVEEVTDEIFEREVTQCLKNSKYIGIWHVAAIASI